MATRTVLVAISTDNPVRAASLAQTCHNKKPRVCGAICLCGGQGGIDSFRLVAEMPLRAPSAVQIALAICTRASVPSPSRPAKAVQNCSWQFCRTLFSGSNQQPNKQKAPHLRGCLFIWRSGRDSNPRYVAVQPLSRRPPSTTRTPDLNGCAHRVGGVALRWRVSAALYQLSVKAQALSAGKIVAFRAVYIEAFL